MKLKPQPILLAEDNPYDAELTIQALKENAILNPIVHVPDGAEVLNYLYQTESYQGQKTTKPILILLDLKMPKIDGLEVLEKLKQDLNFQPIPIIMLTSSKEEIDLIQSYKNGANAYVVKPVDFDNFVDAVKIVGHFWCIVNEPPPLNKSDRDNAKKH